MSKMSELTILDQHVVPDGSVNVNQIRRHNSDENDGKNSARKKGYNIEVINCHTQDKQDCPSMQKHRSGLDLHFLDDLRDKDTEPNIREKLLVHTAPQLQQDLLHTFSKEREYTGLGDSTDDAQEPEYASTSLVPSMETEEQRQGQMTGTSDQIDDDNVSDTTENTNEVSNEDLDEDVDFPNLSEQEILRKLQDTEVIKQCNVINSLGNISVANLQKLEQLDRTDPVVKRLLTRSRLTAREVKEVNVDADIKAVVNEFLGTNATGNFIMSRVLRENFSAFYSWLTTHIQVERNAWASRLKQALEMLDMQRRGNLEIKDLMVESTKKLQHLIMMCSEAMFRTTGNIGKKETCQTPHRDTTRGFPSPSSQACFHEPGLFSEVTDESVHAHKHSFNKMIYALDILSERTEEGGHLSNTSSMKHNPVASSISTDNSNGDPDVCFLSDESCRQNSNVENSKRLTHSNSCHVSTERPTGEKNRKGKTFILLQPELSNTGRNDTRSDKAEMPTCNSETTNYDHVLRDYIDVLTELCEQLIIERMSFLRWAEINPEHYSSSMDDNSTYNHDRHIGGHNNKTNAAKRLGVLETENRNLQNEVNDLKSILAKKNNETLNLQHQFERLQSLLNDCKPDKTHTCLGLGNSVINNSHLSRKTNTGYNSIEKVYDGLQENNKSALKSNSGDTKTHNANDVNLIVPHSVKLTPENRVQFHGSKSSGLNVFFTSSEAYSSSSREKLVRNTPERMQKRLRVIANVDSLHETPAGMEIIAKKDVEQDACNLQISVSSGQKVSALQKKISRPTNTNPSNSQRPHNSPYLVYEIAKPQPVPHHVSINRKHSGGNIAQIKDIGRDFAKEVQILNKSSLLASRSTEAATLITQTGNETLSNLPQCTHIEADGTTQLQVDDGYQFKKKNYANNIMYNADTTERYVKKSHEYNVKQNAKTKFVLQTNVLSLASTRVRANGKVVISKCLRCQKLFNLIDNHKLACSYHTEPMTRVEKYNESGQMIQVANQWACCLQPGDSEGCCHGQHI